MTQADQKHTLVLGADFTPIDRVSWQRAITLWWVDKVMIVHAYAQQVRSTSLGAMQVPSVVAHKRPLPRRKRTYNFSRANVYARDKGRCQYCATYVPFDDYQYEHVVPRDQGGKTDWHNIVVSCNDCNQYKRNRTPQQAGMILLSKPIRPRSLPAIIPPELRWHVGLPAEWRPYLDALQG